MGINRRHFIKVLAAAGAAAYTTPLIAFAEQNAFAPRNFAVNMHNGGVWSYDYELGRVLEAKDAISNWRIGPAQVPDVHAGDHRIAEHDPMMDYLLQQYGPDRVLVPITDWNDAQRSSPEHMLDLTLQTIDLHPSIIHIQFGNEPYNFEDKLLPDEYVQRYVAPLRVHIDERNALRADRGEKPLLLWSAPWHGSISGIVQTRQMLEEELRWIAKNRRTTPLFDGICANIYGNDSIAKLEQYFSLDRLGRPIKITETGVNDASRHEYWINDVMVRMQSMLDSRAARVLGTAYAHDHPYVQSQWVTFYDFTDDEGFSLLNRDLVTDRPMPTSGAWERLLADARARPQRMIAPIFDNAPSTIPVPKRAIPPQGS